MLHVAFALVKALVTINSRDAGASFVVLRQKPLQLWLAIGLCRLRCTTATTASSL